MISWSYLMEGLKALLFHNSLRKSRFFVYPGTGPTPMGRVVSCLTTFFSKIFGKKVDLDVDGIPPVLASGLRRFTLPGAQLSSSSIDAFFSWLRSATGEERPFKVVESFYKGVSILDSDPEEIKWENHFRGWISPNNQKGPLIVPLVLSNGGIIEVNHIVVAVVQGDTLYYYDPKGVTSVHQPLRNDQTKTLRDLLESLRVASGATEIKENTVTHQFDIHNCGRYVCFYLEKVILEGKELNWIEKDDIGTRQIESYSREWAKTAAASQFLKANQP